MSEEQTVAIVSFTGAIKREVAKVWKKLKRDESVSYISFIIEASGPADGNIEMKFKLYTNDEEYIIGYDVENLINEMLRRRSWKAVNKPLAITANEQQRADADRMFTNNSDEGQNYEF